MGSMQHPGWITARAPGKINVSFRVGCERADQRNAIAALYQCVSVADEVTAHPADVVSVSITGDERSLVLPLDDRNFAVRAAKHLAETSGYSGGVHLDITKNIPINAGMGSGSADAAATLLACNALWETGLDRSELTQVAAELGCDVSVALEGGTVVGSGYGESLSQALTSGVFYWVVALNEKVLAKSNVYSALADHRQAHSEELKPAPERPTLDTAVLHAVRSGSATSLADVLHNDLQVGSLKLAAGLIDLLEYGESSGALAGITSGASSSLAFLVEDAEAGAALVGAFRRKGIDAIFVTGPVPGARVLSPEPKTVA